MAYFWGCIRAEEAVIWAKEIRASTYKRDISGIGVIILEEKCVQIGLIIAEILFFYSEAMIAGVKICGSRLVFLFGRAVLESDVRLRCIFCLFGLIREHVWSKGPYSPRLPGRGR